MTLLLVDGFDFIDQQDVWTSGAPAGTSNSTTTTVRTGPRAYAMGVSQTFYRALAIGSEADDGVTAGFAFYAASNNQAPQALQLNFNGDTNYHITISIYNSARSIRIYRGNINIGFETLLAESAINLWTTDTWHYLEAQVKIADSGGTVEVRLNGATIVTYAGDTRNGGSADVISVGFSAAFSGQGKFLDDVYILNEQGSAPHNTFLGDCRAWPKLPDGNGNYSQLVGSDADSTNNYQLVDEAGTPSMADFVGSLTAGDKDTYTFEDLDLSVGTVHGVEIRMFAAKTEIGNKAIRSAIWRSATDVAGADFALATTAATYRELYALDPVAAAAWTITNFNNTEFGAEVRDI